MVAGSMAFNTLDGALNNEHAINEILTQIQNSSKETKLWDQPLATRIAEKRTEFMLNMHVKKVELDLSISSSYQLEQQQPKTEELLVLWNEDSNQEISSDSVNEDPNNNNENPPVCPHDDFSLLLQPKLVRRRSSVDSGIIVRTPSEKNETRKYLLVVKSPVRRWKSIEINLNETKTLNTRCRSTSLPNMNEIDLNKFDKITFKDSIKNDQRKFKTRTLRNSVNRSKNLFSLNNYLRGKYKKEKISDLIKRNNTFSSAWHSIPRRFGMYEEDELNSIDDEAADEEYVLTFDINSTDHHGDTCLHSASSKGDIDTVQYLLKSGGNVWLKNNNEQLPIDVSKDFRTAKLLSQATIFYTESNKHKKDNNISSSVKLAFDL